MDVIISPVKVNKALENLSDLVLEGDKKKVKNIFSNHGVNASDPYGRTILHNAVILKKYDIIDYALEEGASIDFQDGIENTSLHYAALDYDMEMVTYLIENDADPNMVNEHGNSPLWSAVMKCKGDFTIVSYLIDNGADYDVENYHDRTPEMMLKTMFKVEIDDL